MVTTMRKYHVVSTDGYRLSVHAFDVDDPAAVVQIIHGMEEHQERYEEFAAFLNSRGIVAVTSDLRGHGRGEKDPGYFKDRGGYAQLIHDQIRIRTFIDKHYPGLPVFLLGHSMGSIIARVLLQTHSKRYEKAVLVGYPNYQAGAAAGIVLSSFARAFRGPKYKSAMMKKLSTGVFNDAVENPRTDSDWICSDPGVVDAFLEDPYCGMGFTCSAHNDLFHLVVMMHRPNLYKNVNADLSFLLLRGSDDPCPGGGKGAADSLRVLEKAGFEHFTEHVYEGMRHEILNEADRKKVYDDVADFLLQT